MNLTLPPSGSRILLIEDEAVIAMTAEDMIEALDCVVAAQPATIDEALHHIAHSEFDIALVDINLNGEMSMPVAQALRDQGKRFIFTTGYGHCLFGQDFADIPIVSKPYTLAILSAAIAGQLGVALKPN